MAADELTGTAGNVTEAGALAAAAARLQKLDTSLGGAVSAATFLHADEQSKWAPLLIAISVLLLLAALRGSRQHWRMLHSKARTACRRRYSIPR